MFKNGPDEASEDDDPIEITFRKMDAHNITAGLFGVSEQSLEARRRYPGRVYLSLEVDPNDITGTVRQIRTAHADHGIKAVTTFPAGCNPQVPVSDRRYYPVYHLHRSRHTDHRQRRDSRTAVSCSVSAREARRRGLLRLSRVAHRDASRRGAVGSAGRQTHVEVAKIMYAGYYPAGITIERSFSELPDVPFKDGVWPKFLRENAVRVFKLDDLAA